MRIPFVAIALLFAPQWGVSASRIWSNVQQEQKPLISPLEHSITKRIAIVGGGTAGVTTLKTFFADLPPEVTRTWEVILFEQRRDVGGVWLPDVEPPAYPKLPETPLYPRLHTNTPHPTMTIPGFPFKPLTYLYPHHPHVQRYHTYIIAHWNLTSHLRLNNEILRSQWLGTAKEGSWQLDILDRIHNKTRKEHFDHLIIANGHNHYPYAPEFDGRKLWLSSSKNRSIVHSIFYREPEVYAGRNVLVVGGGASGRDIAQQIVKFANSTTVSLKDSPQGNFTFPNISGVAYKPRTDRFTAQSVIFSDGSELTHIDTVILATGYNYRVPFLTAGGHLDEIRTTLTLKNKSHPAVTNAVASDHLVTNARYIRPLFAHVLSLDIAYPIGALYFVGLPIFVSNGISDQAAALFAAHTISNTSLLQSRDEFMKDLLKQEKEISLVGDPWYIGHRQVSLQGRDSASNQDLLVKYLQEREVDQSDRRSLTAGRGIIPPKGVNFTDEWRRECIQQADVLKKGWERVQATGQGAISRWLGGVETEEEWATLMRNLIQWEKKQEEDK